MPRSARERFLEEFAAALNDDAGAIFVGAGVSSGAGYPSWVELLHDIGEELGVSSRDVYDLAALAQWSIQTSGGYTRIRKVIRDNIAPNHPVPDPLRIIARLPSRHLWTTNYDRLIERSFEEIGRPIDIIADQEGLAVRARPGAARLYKMHGSIDQLGSLVIATDDYELFRARRGAFLPLLQAHLTSMSMMFLGLSFTDPNLRHVLSLIRESFIDGPPEHFAILKPPHRDDYQTDAEFEARAIQHKLWAEDLKRYGLLAVEIQSYDEVPSLLNDLERRVARRRVWISGSWPPADASAERVYNVAAAVGRAVGEIGMSLVTGAGLVVGSASVAGFLEALRETGAWDLERRLIARPFPQPLTGSPAPAGPWRLLRQELARLSGTLVVIGGAKLLDTEVIAANGVREEIQLAQAAGSFLLPVGATGGVAEELARELRQSSVPTVPGTAWRPTDDDLDALSDVSKTPEELASIVGKIIQTYASS